MRRISPSTCFHRALEFVSQPHGRHRTRWLLIVALQFGMEASLQSGTRRFHVRRSGFHPRFGRALGFRSEFVVVRKLTDPKQFRDALLASSGIPPFMPVTMIGGTNPGGIRDAYELGLKDGDVFAVSLGR